MRNLLVLSLLVVGSVARSAPSPVYTAALGKVTAADFEANYQDTVAVMLGSDSDAATLILTNQTTRTDTAWKLMFAEFPVRAGAEFAVYVRSRGNGESMDKVFGDHGRVPAVLWYGPDRQPLTTVDALGNVVAETFGFDFRSHGADWIRFVTRGRVPAGAAYARLRLGADAPDIRPGQFLEIGELAYYERGGADAPWTFDAEERLDVRETVGKEDFSKYALAASTNGVVTFRDDGMTLVDGRPFFPIGPFGFGGCPLNGNSIDEGIRQLQSIGCNMVHTYHLYPGQTFKAIVAACERQGMKLVGELISRDYSQSKLRGEKRAQVQCEVADFLRNRGVLLFWGVGDDTADHRSPEVVMRDTMTIHAADAAIRTMSVDVIPAANRYYPYVHACDSISPEIYPFRFAAPYPNELGKVVASMNATLGDMRRAGDAVKPIIPVFQWFKGYSSWKRLPTLAEVRAMTYAAIALGARGAMFYTYYSENTNNLCLASSRESFDEFARLTQELASLSPLLVERDAPKQPKVTLSASSSANIVRLLKDGPDGRLLVVVNVADEPTDAAFELGGPDGNWEVVSEGRGISAAAGVLRDRFEARATHLYRLRPPGHN